LSGIRLRADHGRSLRLGGVGAPGDEALAILQMIVSMRRRWSSSNA
jgi:hypothetical protein